MKYSHTEIIKAVIEQAEENGYKFPFPKDFLWKDEALFGHTWWSAVIFSVRFAKAFWGYERIKTDYFFDAGDTQEVLYQDAWYYHLQHMVVQDDPTVYLKKFIKGELEDGGKSVRELSRTTEITR